MDPGGAPPSPGAARAGEVSEVVGAKVVQSREEVSAAGVGVVQSREEASAMLQQSGASRGA